jgi:hypothetical protein
MCCVLLLLGRCLTYRFWNGYRVTVDASGQRADWLPGHTSPCRNRVALPSPGWWTWRLAGQPPSSASAGWESAETERKQQVEEERRRERQRERERKEDEGEQGEEEEEDELETVDTRRLSPSRRWSSAFDDMMPSPYAW